MWIAPQNGWWNSFCLHVKSPCIKFCISKLAMGYSGNIEQIDRIEMICCFESNESNEQSCKYQTFAPSLIFDGIFFKKREKNSCSFNFLNLMVLNLYGQNAFSRVGQNSCESRFNLMIRLTFSRLSFFKINIHITHM